MVSIGDRQRMSDEKMATYMANNSSSGWIAASLNRQWPYGDIVWQPI